MPGCAIHIPPMIRTLSPVMASTSFIATPSNLRLHTAEGWTIPPLDGSLSVPELYDFHYERNPDHPVFVYARPDGTGLTPVPFAELVPAAHRAGWKVTRTTAFDHSADPALRPTVAVLAASGKSALQCGHGHNHHDAHTSPDTITFFTTFVGMFRAGIPFLPISPRNSPAAIAHLLEKTCPTHVLVSADASMRELLHDSFALLGKNARPIVGAMPVFEEIFTGEKHFQTLPPRPKDLDVMRIVVHSSGQCRTLSLILRYSRYLRFNRIS